MSSWPLNSPVAGSWPIATNRPSTGSSLASPVRTWRTPTPVTALGCSVPDHLLDDVVPQDLDLGVREQAVLHDLLGPQAVAAVDQRDLLAHLRQIERLLDRRVAAADDRHRLAAEEEAVAGGAGRDAGAREVALAVEARASAPGRRWR